MKKRKTGLSKVIKCAALFAAVFSLSLPAADKECMAGNGAELVLMEEDEHPFYWVVKVDEGYLALRRAKAYDSRNEIGELYTGDAVEVREKGDGTYWYVYSPLLDKSGYVNKEYLELPVSDAYWTVTVDKGYLALRTGKAYDSRNEIGELYTGDVVEVQDKQDDTYWYVHVPSLGKSGYVNKNYLCRSKEREAAGISEYFDHRTVKVDKGYLALRSEKAYDEKNEIGQLYSGETVEIWESGDSAYWYVYSPKLYKFGYVNKDYIY